MMAACSPIPCASTREPGALSVDWQVVNVSPESTGLRRAMVYHGAGLAGVFPGAAAICGRLRLPATRERAVDERMDKHTNNRMVLLLIAGIPVTMILAQPGFGISWCAGIWTWWAAWAPPTAALWCSRPGRSMRRPAGADGAGFDLRDWSRAGPWWFPRQGAL